MDPRKQAERERETDGLETAATITTKTIKTTTTTPTTMTATNIGQHDRQ